MRKYLLLIPFLLFAGDVASIMGKVYDCETGEPIAGANIVVPGTELHAKSDENGEYVIRYMPPGVFSIYATAEGYDTLNGLNIQLWGARTTCFDFALKPIEKASVKQLIDSTKLNEYGTLKGEVTDEITNKHLGGVAITLERTVNLRQNYRIMTTLHKKTHDNGEYIFLNVPVGEYELTAEMKGYNSFIHDKMVIAFDDVTTFNFSMSHRDTTGGEIPTDNEFPYKLTSSGRDFIPHFSPDGKYIAFSSFRDTYNPMVAHYDSELWMMQSNGDDQYKIFSKKLDGTEVKVYFISWFPDSYHLLVSVWSDGNDEIWKVTRDGKQKTPINFQSKLPRNSRRSPDFKKIAYFVEEQESLNAGLYLTYCDSTEPVLIAEGLVQNYSWKFDSKGIFYSLYDIENENYDLWFSTIDGATKSRISKTPENEKNAICSTDGKYVLYTINNNLYVTPTHVFRPKKLTTDARLYRWVPGKDLVLIFSEQTDNHVKSWTESWIIDLEGNIVKKIAEGNFVIVDFSPDGNYFVYLLSGNLWIDRF